MTILNIIYCVLGAVFLVLGVACLAEKYRTVHGAALLPARVLRCTKEGTSGRKGAGGYHFEVEFDAADGHRHTARTNDAFWFNKEKSAGNVIEIYYNEKSPAVVERKSIGAELLSAAFMLLGVVVILWLGLP